MPELKIAFEDRLIGAYLQHDYQDAPKHPVRFWDDGIGPLWLYRSADGDMGIVRAQTFEDAYDCVLDEILKPIPADEVPEAYGFYGPNKQDDLAIAETAARITNEYPELVEGFQYQPNGTGTGIVSICLNGECLEPLTDELLKECHLHVEIEKGE